MIGTLLVRDGKRSGGARRAGLVAALLLPLLVLVAVSAGSIVRGAEAQQLVLAETYRQVAELVSNHLSHRLVDTEEYLVGELAAGKPSIDVLAQRVNDWERQQPGLRPMALIGASGELLRPLSVNDRELEAIILKLPDEPDGSTPRIAPVSLSRGSDAERDGRSSSARPMDSRRARASMWAFSQRLNTVQCQLDSKRYDLAASTALAALRYLIENRFHVGEASFDNGLARTQALLDAIPLSPSARAELRELRQEADRLDGVEEALRSLVTSLQQVPEIGISFDRPRIDLIASSPGSGEPLAIAELPGTTMRLVHRIDLSNIEAVMRDALDESGPLSDAGVAVVDATGRPVAGDVEAVPEDAALVPLAAVPGLQVAAFPRSGSLAQVARQDLLRNGALLLGALVALAVAGTLGVRAVRRDIAVSRMRADFVSSVSHELKTPLALLSASAENLRSGWVPEERRAEYYDTMMGEAQRLSHLVDNVLDFRRMEAGAKSFAFSATDLRDVVDDSLALYQMPAASAGIELTVEYPDAPVIARVDREAIHQVVANLLSNATKYCTGEAGRVAVRVRDDDGALTIAVSDNGIGMTRDDVERAFEPFYRGSGADAAAGSGIGLSIVRHVVAAHGGTVGIDSAPGDGTTVTVRLPSDDERRGGV